MQKIIITGGPHSGKTTTMEALKETHPEAFFVAEAAERVIERENRKVEEDPNHVPLHPVTNFPGFAPAVFKEALELEAGIPDDAGHVFMDRSLIDHIGYSRLNEHEVLLPEIQREIEVANYAFALFCAPVGEYTKTEIRHEEPEIAVQIHDHLLRAYTESGLEIIHLPPVSLEERLVIISDAVESYS